MKRTSILTFSVLLLTSMLCNAQTARLYTSESGLTNSQINDIYQDSKGFIWIATENGLSRFDGMNFSTFRFDRNRENSISSNLVLTTFEDSKGTMWIGTSAGLQVFNNDLNSFTDIDLGDAEVPASDQHISDIAEIDFDGDRTILISSSGHGIYAIDPDTHEILPDIRNEINASILSPFVSHLFQDSDKNIWIGYENGGLSFFNTETDRLVEGIWDLPDEENMEDVMVNVFKEDDNNKIIIGTFNHGILIYDKETGRIRKAASETARDCRVMSMVENNIITSQGRRTFLVGSENEGLKIFDSDTESLKQIQSPQIPYFTSTWKIHSLTEDNQGNVWIGAYQTGILVLPKSMYGFDYMHFSQHSEPNDNSSCVTSIAGDPFRGCLWVGTDGGGLFRVSKDGDKTNLNERNSGISNNSIMSLAIDKRGNIWIATYLGGLFKYTPETGFKEFKGQHEIDTDKTVCLAYSEDEDILYVGTHGKGLAIIDLNNEEVIDILAEDDYKWISTLYIDKSKMLWIGTYNGPMCYDHKVRKLIQYDVDETLTTRIQSFCESSDGKMWIGTGEGLVCFEKSTGTITSYSEDDGLPSNVITDIQESLDGHLWISTQNGLSRLNRHSGDFKNYYRHDGLQENEFHARASYKAPDGKLHFGGIKGLSSFYPHIVDQRSHPVPPIYFSDLSVMNEQVEYDPKLGKDNILDKNITEATSMKLPYDSNIFSIEFSVLEYTNPHKIVFSYMMEGFDDTWNTVKPIIRTATYTNLPSGRYKLKVKAFFEGEPDKFSYRELDIDILPPWYGSIWAYMVYMTIGILVIWTLIQLNKKHKLQKREREESEIKELKLRMFTNISHEIRTPLTLVMNPLKKMREAETDKKQKELYNLMYRNSLRILRLVNQLLDMRKVDNGQMQLHFLETDVIYFIRDIMQSFENVALSRDIIFSMSTENDVTNVWIDQGNFDKIIFNILSNAFKYTPDGGHITINVSSPRKNNGELQSNVDEFIEFLIENSGSMVEDRHLDKLFDRFFQVDVRDAKVGSGVGLNLTKMLVELHHGSIHAFNTDTGMAFCIRIPVGHSHLSASEMTKPTNHKDLYTKAEDHASSREDVTYTPESSGNNDIKQLKSKKSIVLVDDDSEMRSYLKLELNTLYNVESCANAKEAWGRISTTIPDAVITDLIMEGMDGAELCAKIKKNPGTNHIPVLILTSSGDEQNIQRCIDSGADRFFTKPISLEILKGAIANAIITRETIRNKFSKEIDYGYSEMEMPDSGNHLIDKVIRIIRENIEKPDFGVEDLSHEVGMSRVHLNRKLKETMNISPSNLIKSIRLKQAAYLLINNKVNISEVAYKVGFSTHSYFSNSFHDFFGMTPKEFVARYTGCEDEETLKKIFR